MDEKSVIYRYIAFDKTGRAGAAFVMGMLELVKRMHTLADYVNALVENLLSIVIAFDKTGRAGAAIVKGMLELVKRMHTVPW